MMTVKILRLELTVNRESLKIVLEPIFQRAIDISIDLLPRNNLSANNLQSLVLVGGPTLSLILRDMLEQQICKPDTSVDPMIRRSQRGCNLCIYDSAT